MKKTSILILLFIVFSTCSNHVDPKDPDIVIPEGVKESLAFEYLIHDVEGIVFNMLHYLHERDRGEARTHVTFNIFSGRGACASQNLDTDLNQLILDFSSGCSDNSDRVRKGVIDISYTDPENGIGNVMEIVLTDFALNNLVFNGEIRIENVSNINSDDQKDYMISFSNLALTINLESSIFTGVRTVHYEKADGSVFETTEVEYFAENNIDFLLSNGSSFNLTTPTATKQGFGCWLDGFYLPSFGIQRLSNSGELTTIDYNTGGCDLSVSLQTNNENPGIFVLSEIL